ncbi:amino acid adenylation domain-containing protein [uncultured Bradyrhizobium sp.]|uniref:amino acid adenylation domain-containing protein n=1 Tax=uncultured Bradyrhizobium sp. TaxID=199684 RepID=UPI0035CC24A7
MTTLEDRGTAALRQPPAPVAGRLPGNLLHRIFEERARQAPHRIAVALMDETVSYGELDRRANQLAHKLQQLDVGPETLVGLCVDRSIEMIVGLLAILKAGGAYVPIDPSYPAKRIRFLLDDSAVSVVVTVARVASCLADGTATILCIDDEASELSRQPDHAPALKQENERSLAYVIYTSGSTGLPKGVLVEHHSVVRLFEQTHRWFGFDERDVWTMFHSIGFDFSVWEIWGALLYGGRLVIVPYDVSRSAKQFHALIQKMGVTVLNQTPSAFRQLVAEDGAAEQVYDLALRLVIFGGEALDLKTLEPWIGRRGDQRPALVNMYGITETTVHVTYRRLRADDLKQPNLSPIGIPIPDLKIHLLDASRQPVADGTPGDIYVSGPGVARGYLNRSDLTAERFLAVGGGQGKLYNSGDRAVRLSNGELNYLGRADDQIKVRGFRIEPKEIEFCLGGHPAVASSVVVPRDYGEGDVRLIAYVVPKQKAQTLGPAMERLSREMTELAATELPLHMRPSAYVFLSSLPMTAHGKIDRAALPSPAARHAVSGEAETPPPNSIAQALTALWEDILEVKGIKVTDDFFDVGGTSLALARMFGRMSQLFGVSLDFSVLIEGATIERLAACVGKELRSGSVTA